MKKILNTTNEYVKDSVLGVINAHGDKLSLLNDDFRIVIRKNKKKDKVAIVTGGGSGHLPLFLGYVGEGMLDACAVGNVFASPSSTKMYEAIKYIDCGKGVLCLYGNYGGDKMNFNMATEMADFDDINIKHVIVSDDIASSDIVDSRRGVAGMIFMYKIAGAASELGYSLEEIVELCNKASNNIRTMGIALSACIVPEVGKSTFTVDEDKIEIGMGIHGEKGIETINIKSSKEIVDIIIDKIETEIKLEKNEKISVMINGLGSTPLEELYIVYNDLFNRLNKKDIKIIKPHIGEFATSMEMAGLSITVFKLDEELEKLLLEKAETPFYK
ncbi:dihydroxyacetone kinase subunit DhaK [Oceanivirga salmonicida]|uniref:dihydroxyacetone kinase subunit DhaK n=1 Tax=Oceanivirga salmonicida TaxID=1769291 RepID=UPI0012E1B0C5|nr:dihydroxyacetone kinase subunit DhaK [Oceanivirga salmonicida]